MGSGDQARTRVADARRAGIGDERDRLCVVQISPGDGSADVIQIAPGQREAPNLARIIADPSVTKIFHYGRFDIAVLYHALGVMAEPAFCTKIASRLTRTYTDRFGLKDLCKELLGVDLSKQQQSSDWGADTLSREQMEYAASDVLHLHALKAKLDQLLAREGRTELADAAFRFLPWRARLDLAGWPETDLFAH